MNTHHALCECSDPVCAHGNGRCAFPYDEILYRINQVDHTGTLFCACCAEDAMDSGLFTDGLDEGEYDDGSEPIA